MPIPSKLHNVILRRLNRWQAEELREDLADLYVESVTLPVGEGYQGREAFLDRFADEVQQPGFTMLIGEASALVGYAFGYPIERDGSWWQGLDVELPRYIEQLTASGHVFAIGGLVVHPHERDQGLAGRLYERLLADHQASLGATLVDQRDRSVNAALESLGWRDIGVVARPPGPVLLRALVLPLDEETSEQPDGLAHNSRTQRPGRSADTPSMPRKPPPESQ